MTLSPNAWQDLSSVVAPKYDYGGAGMNASGDVLYYLKNNRPTYQWIAMMKTIIIGAQYGSRNRLVLRSGYALGIFYEIFKWGLNPYFPLN